MASRDSLLDAHEVAVRARVEELRERAARVAAELGEAELALEHVAITKATLAVVLAGGGQAADGPDGDAAGQQAASERAAVPSWSVVLDERALPTGYRELWAVLVKAPDGVRCKAATVSLGLEPVPRKVEGVRSKMRLLVRRGWAVEATPGVFQPAAGPAATGG